MGKVSEKLLRELGFATILLVCIPSVIHHMNPELFLSMLSITRFNNTTWFVGYYFMVQLCGALFLNDFLGGLDYKKYTAFLLTPFAFISFSWSGGLAEGLTSGLRMLLQECSCMLWADLLNALIHSKNYAFMCFS